MNKPTSRTGRKRKAAQKPRVTGGRRPGGKVGVVAKPAPVEAPAVEAVTAKAGLRLESSCTLREAEDLHFAMLGIKSGAEPLEVNAGAVERIDTAGLQLLACLVRGRAAMGGSVRWAAVSPALQRGAARLGMLEILSLPAGNPGDTP